MTRLRWVAVVTGLILSSSVLHSAQVADDRSTVELGEGPAAVDDIQIDELPADPGDAAQSTVANPPTGESPDTITELRDQYKDLEDRTTSLADSIRSLGIGTKNTPEHGEGQAAIPGVDENLRQQLKLQVKAVFEARQRLQEAELAARREQLQSIEQSIQSHETSKDEIVNHRVRELLNPYSEREANDGSSGSRDGQTPATSRLDGRNTDSMSMFPGDPQSSEMMGQYTGSPPKAPVNSLPDTGQLHSRVKEAFDLRQRTLRAELKILRQRLAEVKRLIESREIHRDAIIEHRIKQLLNPELERESALTSRQEDSEDKTRMRKLFVSRFPHTVSADIQQENPESSLSQFVDISPNKEFAVTIRNTSDNYYACSLWRYRSGKPISRITQRGTAATVRFAEKGNVVGVRKVWAGEVDVFDVPTGQFLETLSEVRSKPWQTILDEYGSTRLEKPAELSRERPRGDEPSGVPLAPTWLGVGMNGNGREVTIMQVHPKTGAEDAGLQVGDRILALDGQAVSDVQQVVDRTIGRNPGERIVLLIRRGDELLTVEVRLSEFQPAKEQGAEIHGSSINPAEINTRLAKIRSDEGFVQQAYREFLDRAPTEQEQEAFIESTAANRRQLLVIDLLTKSGHIVKQLVLPEDRGTLKTPEAKNAK